MIGDQINYLPLALGFITYGQAKEVEESCIASFQRHHTSGWPSFLYFVFTIRRTLLVWQAQICSLLDPFHPFPNAFEMAFFFWIWIDIIYNLIIQLCRFIWFLTSCIMGKVKYIIPRIVIGVFIQVLCSYSTLPLYAIVTQMGSNFKKAIFDEDIRLGLVGWAKKAKRRRQAWMAPALALVLTWSSARES
ncbi:unnamed protein product [Prunus armeniaca]|uniref:MLO-like protein n=2 Tax=Prunus armeniaca TaxID=36596 RepID=A0A6J5U2C5_PRUAR|nr:unnamed protein product [Prunus armeniaca]